jgi:hypothetical protein
MAKRVPLTSAQRIRYALYAAAVTIAVLAVVDAAITALEQSGAITITSSDDQVSTITGDPWLQRDDRFVLSTVAKNSMIPMSFTASKPADGFRLFMVGGSFMRGIPYDGAGTIRFWLYRELRRRFPTAFVEIINAGATSQNSHRVREIAQHAVKHDTDVMIIASCNNEGALPPGLVQKRLIRSGTFRLLKSVLRTETRDGDRPLHTPQDPDIDQVRQAFRDNLVEIVRVARENGVSLYLSTLPLNLRYAGNSPGRPIGDKEHPDNVTWSPCVNRGHALFEAQNYEGAITELSLCEDIEALRWIGLSHYQLGNYQTARDILRQYTEVEPRNRCRPSFQQIIRDVAQAEEIPLIDLEQAVNNASPHGIPGPELFVSYCHMNWAGQALVADTMFAALRTKGDLPAKTEQDVRPEDRRQVFETFSRKLASESYYY